MHFFFFRHVCVEFVNITERRKLRSLGEKRDRSSKILIQRDKDLYVLLLFNVSLRDRWTVYSYKYDTTPLGEFI